jgi:fructose-bisphosphate aldolase class I
MVATFGKGIMACDESPGTVGDGFAKVGIDNTEENRRLYRCVISLSLNSLTEA